jgi:hypothetical protein
VRIKKRGGAAAAGRTLLDPAPEPPAPARQATPGDRHAGREVLEDIEVARRLIARAEHGAALELLQASLRAHPGNECLRALITETETACIDGLRRSVDGDAVPIVLEIERTRVPLNAEESFLLSLIDGESGCARCSAWPTAG